MKKTAFGSRLRVLRESAGLTQAQLAERAGLHLHGLTKLEQGYREPSWPTVIALAKALSVGCDAFMQEAEDVPVRGPGRPPKAAPSTTPADELQAEAQAHGRAGGRATGGDKAAKARGRARKGK